MNNVENINKTVQSRLMILLKIAIQDRNTIE